MRFKIPTLFGVFATLLFMHTESEIFALAQTPSALDYSAQTARRSPDWVRDGVIYEIFPRVFSAEANFNGITRQLDRLQDLGVSILWLMPIHPIGQEQRKGTYGSPYAVRDYYAINPDYGTREDLRRLISEAHRRGMKVIIDIVANHTAWDSVMMRQPALYKHDARGRIIPPIADWTDVAGLDYANPETRAYMTEMLKFWIRDFDLDGFRCDVAGMVPTDFWNNARAELEKIKPDILMLAEWHEPELLVKAFDLDYAWPLHTAITEVLQGMKPASELRAVWEAERAHYPQGALHLRFSDNHDERRAIARFGERGALVASVFVFTLDGVPLIYNGMEVGDTAESCAPALFERVPIFWQIAERRPEFPQFYKQIVALRAAHSALRRGALVWLNNSDPSHIVTFVRRDASEEILVAINFSGQTFNGTVESGGAANFADITPDVATPLLPGSTVTRLAAGKSRVALPNLTLDAWGYKIYRRALH